MIHQPLGGTKEQATDIRKHADRIIKMREKLNTLMSEQTGKSIEIINKDTERDFFMTAHEAKEYGLVDSVMFKHGILE